MVLQDESCGKTSTEAGGTDRSGQSLAAKLVDEVEQVSKKVISNCFTMLCSFSPVPRRLY